MKVHVYQDEVGEYHWQLRPDNGEIIADSAEGYLPPQWLRDHDGEKLNPGAEFVIDNKSES